MSHEDHARWADDLRSKYGIPAPEIEQDAMEDLVDEAIASVSVGPWMEGQ